LRKKLIADKQVLVWDGPRREPPIRVRSLSGIVVDDRDARSSLGWKTSSASSPYVGQGYQHDGDTEKGEREISFTADIPQTGLYEVRVYYSPGSNRSINTPYIVTSSTGTKEIVVNQKQQPNHGKYHLLGRFPFEQGKREVLRITNQGTKGHVVVDALQLVPVKSD